MYSSMNFIEECESENIHLSGMIQPHGLLIVTNKKGLVVNYSANLRNYNLSEAPIKVGELLPDSIKRFLVFLPEQAGKHTNTQFLSECGTVFDLTISYFEGAVAFEFYCTESNESASAPRLILPDRFSDTHDLVFYRDELLSWIQLLTQHERVMYLQFMNDNDGTVVSEVCIESDKGSYLDLRFPASDIPLIARELYIKNPWREIPSSKAEDIPIIGRAEKPDLSYVVLRIVSPIHKAYMENMGIESSLSFPIIKKGHLDALITCHSSTPKYFSRERLLMLAAAISQFSLLLREMDTRMRLALIDEFNIKSQWLTHLLSINDMLESFWDDFASFLTYEYEADSIVLCSDNNIYIYGMDLGADFINFVDGWYKNECEEIVFYTDHLSGVMGDLPLSEVAGLAALKFRVGNKASQLLRLYMMRGEFLHEVKWGGNPNKPLETYESGVAISPRQSFSKWVEKRLGYSKPWAEHTKLKLHRFRGLLESSKIFEGNV